MFSNNQNIETLAGMLEEAKRYASLQKEYVKLNVVEKTVKVLTVLIMTIILVTLVLLSLIYFSFATAYALEPYMGLVSSFLLVGTAYLLLILVVICFHKKLIVKPLVRFLASLLMD